MSITQPNRIFINNDRRKLDMFADQFSVQLPAPVQGATRFTIESILIENNPEYPNFPPYASNLTISAGDLLDPFTFEVEIGVDWTTYEVNGQSVWPKNFQEYLNEQLTNRGSAIALTLEEGGSRGFPGRIFWEATGDIELLGASNLDNPEASIMERLGLPFRQTKYNEPEFRVVDGRARFSFGTTGVIAPTTYNLGRTGSVYLLTDLDNAGQSDVAIQNLVSVIPVRPGVGLGDTIEGEDTNSIVTSTSPNADFNAIQIILLDDNYRPFELRENARVIVEFHFAYDRQTPLFLH